MQLSGFATAALWLLLGRPIAVCRPNALSRQKEGRSGVEVGPKGLALKAVFVTVMMCLCGYSAVAQTDVDTLMSISPNAVDELVKYKARDSVAMDLQTRRAFLYSEGKIDYGEMILEADRVEVDFGKQTLHAYGTTDTAGEAVGRPFFKQDEDEYHADTITYNYNSQKGIIQSVITQEGEGYLHGKKVKKLNDSVMYLSGGSYTTCNYAHPHFAINFTK